MRPETQAWWAQGEYDLAAARALLDAGIFFATAFLCHQATEKWLKAVYIERKRELPPKTHNLVELGRLLSVPEEVMHALRVLNPEYVAARYPDAANGIPAENYDRLKTEGLLSAAEKVRAWATSALIGSS
ncbi:MAG: HEPN domain-containing protein [Candidatus Bipolaricaulota bacterium]|nr:HEPN domain-containing protein [Candidatus Bipolaricaulota bacterium]